LGQTPDQLYLDFWKQLQDPYPSVRKFLEKGVDPNIPFNYNPGGYDDPYFAPAEVFEMCPLSFAIRHGNVDLVKILLDFGADPMTSYSRDYYGRTTSAIIDAVQVYHTYGTEKEIFFLLIDAKIDLTQRTVGFNYLSNPDEKPIWYQNRGGETILHFWPTLFSWADPKLVDTVFTLGVKAGVDVNDHELAGYSPLMVAIGLGKYEAAEKILKFGGDLNLGMGPDSLTILHALSYEWSLDKLAYINEKGGRFDLLDKQGRNALHYLYKGALTKGIGFARRGFEDDDTVLFKIQTNSYKMIEIASFLITEGCDPFLEDNEGWSFVSLCQRYASPLFKKWLIEQGYVTPGFWLQLKISDVPFVKKLRFSDNFSGMTFTKPL